MENETIAQKLRRWAKLPMPFLAAKEETRTTYNSEMFGIIADEIEKEQQEHFQCGLEAGIVQLAQHLGKPFEEGEHAEEWLDRWYLPRPLFEDGEPVQFGEDAFGLEKEIDTITLFPDGSGQLSDEDENVVMFPFCMDGKPGPRRPAKALDANGEPINVGDTLYYVPGTRGVDCTVPWTVIEVLGSNNIGVGSGREIPDEGYDHESWGAAPDLFTHREPDSLEKLLEDMRDCNPATNAMAHLWIDRLAAIMERDA